MNANVENVVMEVVINDAVALTDTKSKRVAKPKLPAKLERSMIFGFWFANLLLRGQFIGDETLATMYDKLKIYESLENQTELYNIFESEMNATQKTLRKSIADYHKPPKAPRASKKPAVDGQVAAQKKGRKKKTTEVVVDNNDDFITQLVAVANSGVDAVNTIQNVVVDQSVCATVVTSEVVSKTTKPKKKVVAKPVAKPVESVSVLIPETVQAVEVTQNIIIPLNSTGVPESKTEMKTKKTSAIQKVNELLATVAPIAVSEKKPRKKAEPKSTVVETVVATVTEPVVVATVTEPVVVATVTEPIATEVKEKVPRKVESQKGKAEREKKEKKEKVVKEKAEPKLKKVEPPAVVTVVKPVETVIATTVLILDDDDDQSQHTRKLDESDQDDDDEEEEEEIHAREFVYNDKQYLIDENSNEIYDFTTQDLIGQYDPITKNIQFH